MRIRRKYHNNDDYLQERPSPSAVRRAAMGFTACVARVGAQIDAPTFVIKDEQG